MPVLQPSEYDASYFDGRLQVMRHNAGYSIYERWPRIQSSISGISSSGEFWRDKAIDLNSELGFGNKRVLEIGCAKGFIVKDLRDIGVNCSGIDVSAYAVGQADQSVISFLTVGDVKTALSIYNNNFFAWVFSLRFWECMADADVPALITEINRISRDQYHEIDEQSNVNFYNNKILADWLAFGWESGTTLKSRQTNQVLVK